jgi:hypothetical protein
VSQKLVRALARPLKVDLDLGPVISRLEKGAELFGGAHIGAPRLGVKCSNQPTPAGVGPGGGLEEDQANEPDAESAETVPRLPPPRPRADAPGKIGSRDLAPIAGSLSKHL